jgi:hypothetical protein
MKRVVSSVIAATFAATVGLAAQGAQAPSSPAAPPPAPTTQAPQSPSPTGTSGRDQTRAPGAQSSSSVTISGCIENAPPSAAAAPGATKEEKFVLANAKPSSSSSPAAGAVGTSGTASRYELDGQSAELTKHLNHQVEITGTVQPASAGAAAGAASAAPKLMVSSVKMVAAKCAN